jgi:hypothetical protein
MTTDLVGQLEQLAHRVGTHPSLDLIEHDVSPPASGQAIHHAEHRAGVVLPSPVRHVYESANGAVVRWRFRPDIDLETKERVRSEFSTFRASPDSVFDVAGSIRLLPLEDMLLCDEYSLPTIDEVVGQFDFGGRVYTDNEFVRLLRPFDLIDDFFCMAFVVADAPDWPMLLLSDYWIEYDHSRVTYVEDYLRYVIATWGLRMARDRLFGEYRGDRRPALEFDADSAAAVVPPTLSGSTP